MQASVPEPIRDPRIQRLLENFSVDPIDLPTFRVLEEHLFLASAWSQLAGVYECRIAALDSKQPEWAHLMLRLGRLSAERLGDPSAARRRYEEIVQSQPSHHEAMLTLRRLCTDMGDLGSALQLASQEEQLDLPPRERAAMLAEVGDLYRSLGVAAEARRRLDDALALDPSCDPALAGAAALAEDERRIDEAIRLHEARLDGLSGGARTEVMEQIAGLLPESEKERIRSLLREVVRASPKRRAALERLIEIEKSFGSWERVDELQRSLWRLLDEDERRCLALEAATLQLEKADDLEAAQHWAGRAGEVAGSDPDVLELRAHVFRRSHCSAALIETLVRLLEGQGGTRQQSLELAELYEREGQSEAAAQRLQVHMEQHPTDREALALLDHALARSGQDVTRKEVLKQRIAQCTDPEDGARLCTALGALFQDSLQDPSAAERAYRDALDRLQGYGPAAHRLQQLLQEQQRVEELAAFLEVYAAQAATPAEKAQAWCKLGALRLQAPADPEAALVAYVWALECDAEAREAIDGLRRVAEISGDATALREACERELALKPDDERSAGLLGEIIETSRELGDLPRARRAAERWAELQPGVPALRARVQVGREMQDAACERAALETLESLLTSDEQERARVLVRLGDLALEQADPESPTIACRWYRESLAFDSVPEVRERLTDLYRQTGNLSQLAFELRAMLNTSEPEASEHLRSELAHVLAELGDYAGASAALEPVFTLDPGNRDVGDLFERLLAEQGRNHELSEVLSQRLAREREPADRRELALRLGNLLIDRLARPADALAVLNEFADPRRTEALERLYARALELAGSVSEHEAWLAMRESHVDGEERLNLLLRLATIQEQDGRAELALTTLQRAERLAAPEQRELVRRSLLALLRELGEPETQLHFLNQLIEDTEDPAARNAFRGERARIRAQFLNQPEQALNELEEARAEGPLGLSHLRLLISLCQQSGDCLRQASALEALAQASQSPDEVGQALRELAELRLEGPDEVRDRDEAERVLRRLLALDPNTDGALDRYLRLLEESGRPQDLASLLEESLASSSLTLERRGALALRLAQVQGQLGELAAAVTTLDRAREAGADSTAIDELLFESLQAAGALEGRSQLCEQNAARTTGITRERWLRRQLATLAESDAAPEMQLAVVGQLLDEKPGDLEAMTLALPLLRRLGRVEALGAALEGLLSAAGGLSEGRRRVYTQELLHLYEGALANPEAALTVLEGQLQHDPALRPRVARLAARVGDPQRLVELLSPLVLKVSQATPVEPEWVHQLGLALVELGQNEEAEPLLWRALEANPLDRELIQALEQRVRERQDTIGLLRLFEIHFPLESASSRVALATEAFTLADKGAAPELALRWLRRWQALQPLPRKVARRWLGLEREVGDTSGALLALQTLRALSRDTHERAALLADEAQLHQERGELELAREHYVEAIRIAANPKAAWLNSLDRVLATAGRETERIEVLRTLLQRADIAPAERARQQREYIALLSSQPELRVEATVELRQLIDSEPAAQPQLQIKRMRTLLELHEELDQTAEWCARAEQLLPLLSGTEHAELERELAQRLTRSLHDRERAILRWEGVLTHAPDDAEALAALADLLGVAGYEAKRAQALERLAEVDPSRRAASLLEAARLRWDSLRDAEGALAAVERALTGDAKLIRAHELRREVCAYLERPEQESASLRVLLSEQPADGEAPARWLRLGQLLLTQAETTNEVIEAADKAMELAPGDGSLQRQVRQLFGSAGAWTKARALLRREIELAEPAQRPELLRELARIDWDEVREAEAACASLEELARAGTLDSEDRLRWADALAQQERWPESFEQRHRALAALGEMAPARAWLDLAKAVLERTDDAARALDACNKTLERDPDLDEALAVRARVHAILGNVSLELEDRVRLGKRLPPGPEAAEALAHAGRLAYDELKDKVQARALFQAALERDSSRVSALLGAGRIALDHEEWSEAERTLGLACSLLRENSEGQSLARVAASAARAALKLQHKSEAFLYLELALEHEPHHPEALDTMAELSLERGAYAQARRCLEARLADSDLLPPARAERLARLAKTCEASGDLGSAASALVELISLRPEDESACTQALDLFERLGASERAVTEIDAWIKRVPSERRTGLALRAARFEAHMGRVAEARQRLEALLQVEGDRPETWAELSGLVFEHDGSEAALEITQRGLALFDPPSERAPLLWIEAQALLALARVSEAAPRAYDALVADPSNIDAARMLAAHLGLAGDWKQAASQLERTLLVTHPSASIQAELWEAIGRAYAGPLEDIERAERSYRRALECNQWHSSAREALADVTAFDPASHPESIRQHRDLLEEFPTRTGSWRALARIANYWKRRAVKQTCETVLATLTGEGGEGQRGELALSRLAASASAPPLIAAATEVMRALEEGSVLPESELTPSADTLEGEISLAIRRLAGHWWELGDEALRSVWQRATTADTTRAADIRRRARRRIRRALRGIEREALRKLDPNHWREQVLAQAAAMVLSKGKHSLADVLLHLLAHWPTTSHLGLCAGGDLGAAVQLCPPARALLLRIRDAALDALGL